VAGVEQFDLADDGAFAAEVAPVQAEAQEDPDVSTAFGAERFGFLAGVCVVDVVEFDLVQYGVADGGEVYCQPE
jgi:hypothetical protein